MSYQWIYAQPEQKYVSDMQEELGVPQVIARLLAIRGITDFGKAKRFFRPDISDIHSPYLLKDMDKAATRLAEAIRNCETIVVSGDYDVDGTTGTSLLYSFLKDFGIDAHYYIPHRYKEGYGINPECISFAKECNANLIISVDCGITAFEEAEMIKQAGMDFIICDHHTVGESIPEALAVVDPKRPDCSYPFDGLSGAGVGFKLIEATAKELGLPQSVANKFLDLVAVSIASDIVPLADENRILMREGLKILNNSPRIGLKALMELINMKIGHISTSHIVFSLGPRINAAGRMGDAKKAVELMIAEDENEARRRAHQLEKINKRRRNTDTRTTKQAVSMVKKNLDMDKTGSIVLHNPDWHLGVIGIVASRLVDLYHRPAIMLSTVDGMVKGSARSIKGFNIYEALKKCGNLLEQFGGHQYAAGMTLKKQNLQDFRERLNEVTFESLSHDDLQPELVVDSELNLSNVTQRFWNLLNQFEPFGPENQRPVFVSHDVDIIGSPNIVGRGHLKMRISQKDSGVFDVIGFNMHQYEPVLRNCANNKVSIAYALEENYWNGKTTLQIRLKDIHVDDEECAAEEEKGFIYTST